MDDNAFRLLIDEVKDKADLVAEIEATGPGFSMQSQRGRYVVGVSTATGGPGDSLMVTPDWGVWKWWGKDEEGDVFTWLEKYRKMEFWDAVLYLANKYGVEVPKDSTPPSPAVLAVRAQVELFEVVTAWAGRRLEATPAAMGYAMRRGWTSWGASERGDKLPGTIQKARLGFVDPAGRKDLVGELKLYGIDPESATAVAVLGFEGDVKGWARAHGVEDVHSNWVERGRIWGLVDFPRLLYPHIERGKVVYLSGRNLAWQEGQLVSEPSKNKSWNLPRELCGERKVYYNFEYMRKDKTLVIVEGPACAVSWGEWGYSALAMMGVNVRTLIEDGSFARLAEQHERIYWATDSDKAGSTSLSGDKFDKFGKLTEVGDWPVAKVLGPMTWVLKSPMKDWNDVHQSFEGAEAGVQRERMGVLLGEARPLVVEAAEWAGEMKGADKMEAEERVFELILELDRNRRGQYRQTLAKALGYGLREYDAVLKDMAAEAKAKGDEVPVVETIGGRWEDKEGWWLVEFVYDRTEKAAALVVREPNGEVKQLPPGEGVVIQGTKYIPRFVEGDSFLEQGAIKLPSKLGTLRSARDLMNIVEGFLSANYLFDDPKHARIVSYYVLLTWMYDAFMTLPYLRAQGDKGAGKSEMIHRVGAVCYRYMPTNANSSESSLMRTIDEWRGTLGIDESDLKGKGYEDHPLVKIFNSGSMRTTTIWRTEEYFNSQGQRGFRTQAFNPFGPKLIAMRKEFGDDAVASRCITFKLLGKETEQLIDAGIPLEMNEAFEREALQIRNMLLAWRMANWRPRIDIVNELVDSTLNPRLNQVTGPLLALAQEDVELQLEIKRFMRSLYQDTLEDNAATLYARIVEAMCKIYTEEEMRVKYWNLDREGQGWMYVNAVTKVANQLVNVMNRVGVDEEEEEVDEDDNEKGKRKKRNAMHGVGVGYMLKDLGFQKKRLGTGIAVMWDEYKVRILQKKYSLQEYDLDAVNGVNGHFQNGHSQNGNSVPLALQEGLL